MALLSNAPDRWAAGQMPNGVIQLTNQNPNTSGEGTYLYSRGAGLPPVFGESRWNRGTGGYVDARSGLHLSAIGQDRASVMARAMASLNGGPGGGPAFYGDSYGGVQASAQAQANRISAEQIARERSAEAAAQFAASLANNNMMSARDFTNRAAATAGAQAYQTGERLGAQAFTAYQNYLYPPRQYGANTTTLPSRATGGYVPGDPNQPQAVVEGGEYVVPADVTNAITPEVLDQIMAKVREQRATSGRVVPNQVPYYKRGVGYTRDVEDYGDDGGWKLRQPGGVDLPMPMMRGRAAPRRLTQAENNVVNEPANVKAFQTEVAPAMTKQDGLTTAYDNQVTLAKAIEAKMAAEVESGAVIPDPNDKTQYIGATPRAAARLKQHIKDREATQAMLDEIGEKLKTAEDQLKEITGAHTKYGMRLKPSPVAVGNEKPGPAFIYSGQRPVVALPRRPGEVGVPVPTGSRFKDPIVAAAWKAQNDAARAANAAAEEASNKAIANPHWWKEIRPFGDPSIQPGYRPQ